jgi:acylphosphatase
MTSDARQRREVRFRGRVQGVGFRATTRDIAARFAVVGFVQNLSDGQVLLVAEGEPAELDRFLAAMADEMDRYLEGYDVDHLPATGEFVGFRIRH